VSHSSPRGYTNLDTPGYLHNGLHPLHEWYCNFCERQWNWHIFPYKHRRLAACHAGLVIQKMTQSKICLWPTVCERQSDHIFSYDQQEVSDIAHLWKGSLITSFPITNSEWVTLHILWKAVWSHLFLSPTVCEWHKLHILWKAIWSHLFLWPTACEWHCTFCERKSDHIFSYDQQLVSDIAHFVEGSLITSFPITNRKWVKLHILWKAVWSHLFLHITNSEWVTLHILWKAVWSHLFLWATLHIF